MSEPTTLLRSDDGRYFLVRTGQELEAGDLRLVSATGEERFVDPAAIMAYRLTEEQARAHLRGTARQVAVTVVGELARALDVTGGQPPDLERLSERLGLARGGREAEAALRDLAADMEAILGAFASGQPTDLDAVRERLEGRGFNLGETLGRLQRELERIRLFNPQYIPSAAFSDLRAVADSIEDDCGQPPGRRIDELIERLERHVGRYAGQDPKQSRKRRQQEYRFQARSAIADSLREAGIQPLNDPRDESTNSDGRILPLSEWLNFFAGPGPAGDGLRSGPSNAPPPHAGYLARPAADQRLSQGAVRSRSSRSGARRVAIMS